MISIIGCGNLGHSLIRSAFRSGTPLNKISVSVNSHESADLIRKRYPLKSVVTAGWNHQIIRNTDYIFLCVKPKQIKDSILSFGEYLHPNQTIVSTAAGVDVEYLQRFLPNKQYIIRCMPNLPIEESNGVVAIYNHNVNPKVTSNLVSKIFKGSLIVNLPDEEKMDVITTLSGSGPAFVAYFMNFLIHHGIINGLTEKEAEIIAIRTLSGSAKMLASTSIENLMTKVASTGGCTEAGLLKLSQFEVGDCLLKGFKESLNRVKKINETLPD